MIALAWFVWDKFGSTPDIPEPGMTSTAPAADAQQPAIQTDNPATANKSVAVLPFVAMSSGEDDEFFADGLTEEILNSLAQLPKLLVTAHTSSFHFKGQDIPV